VAAALLAAHPAAAKEGVRATLKTAIPLDASAGTRLRIGWSLAYKDEQGRSRPFAANATFVRLLSKTGAGAETAYASSGRYTDGDYTATVTVPGGGIRDLRIGLRGFTSGANGTRNADVLFPIVNDPLPGLAPVVAPAETEWLSRTVGFALGAALLVSAIGGFIVLRRRPRGVVARG
jgi:hypothetical protein